ncbi:MAG: DUF1232 domain-containing protein [Ekhidna sp.]|nr:DUF1232 domain-containing protein [Ekhidna sp.]
MSKAEEIFNKAKKKAGNKEEIKNTLNKATEKLKGLAGNSKELSELKSKLETLAQMAKTHISGEYRAFSPSSIVLIVFALLYFLIPTDLIPDFIPALGFSDDATVVMLIARKLNRDITQFNEWLDTQTQNAQEVES